jgi:hypothetical protein
MQAATLKNCNGIVFIGTCQLYYPLNLLGGGVITNLDLI